MIGNKIRQSQMFDEEGKRIPVTLISVGPCQVVRIKSVDQDGYNALVLGKGIRRAKTVTNAEMGIFKKAGLETNPPRFLKEISYSPESCGELKAGTKLYPDEIFKAGDIVNITGTSRGMGFQGPVKRHHFKGGPRTHGQSDRERAPGAIGSTTTPGRVYKGKRMAGRMGNDRVTVKGLKILAVDREKEILTVNGLVPGVRESLLIINKQN